MSKNELGQFRLEQLMKEQPSLWLSPEEEHFLQRVGNLRYSKLNEKQQGWVSQIWEKYFG